MTERTAEEIKRHAYDAVAAGEIEVVGEQNDEPVFGLTDKGRAKVVQQLNEAIDMHGDKAAAYIADELEIPVWIAEELVAGQIKQRGEQQ